ncbi:MAG: DUF2806 domain-containing protein [Thiotrichales bacterium]|nr:DUF2806 domain-containing protein [Thiotrichales bacterium]
MAKSKIKAKGKVKAGVKIKASANLEIETDSERKVPAKKILKKYAVQFAGKVLTPVFTAGMSHWDAMIKLLEAKAKLTNAEADHLIAATEAGINHPLISRDKEGREVMGITWDEVTHEIQSQLEKFRGDITSFLREVETLLEDKEVPDHDPDPAKTEKIFRGAQDASDEYMRKLWARVLAGEIESPGQVSPRTLDILKNMAQEDAQLFKDICDFVINGDFVYYPETYQSTHPILHFDNILHLQNIGLVYSTGFLSKTIRYISNNKLFFLHNKYISLIGENEDPDVDRIVIPVFLLTNYGKELYHIMECEICMDYLQLFSSFLNENKCRLSFARIIKRNLDGSVTCKKPFIPIKPKREDFSSDKS